jgi:alpha-L-fucosidase
MTTYEPTRASLRQHVVPEWYHDAKLGIFVHWGLYSVPGWAPLAGEYKALIARAGWTGWFARNPYAEWYLNSIRIAGSPSHQHHLETYGEGFEYEQFAPMFTEAIRAWDAGDWADLFRLSGARYVVLTTKHHDGFLLWPSRHLNPNRAGYFNQRDLVGELADAVRAQGMKMGLYYSGGLDWTFSEAPVQSLVDLLDTIPQSAEYTQYAERHWRELIERYQPAVMWNDIGFPAAAKLPTLFADYYNHMPDGVVNDRFMQMDLAKSAIGRALRRRRVRAIVSRAVEWATARMEALPASGHYDFRTPEYSSFRRITPVKWEATRGIGHSFGFNRNEGDEQFISVDGLVHLLVDIVSKNGNLLLNVGPMADGRIPSAQAERLRGLGRWLEINGEAIYGTRPWRRSEGTASDGIPVRFTQKQGALYAILLANPARRLTIPRVAAANGAVHLLGHDGALPWQQYGADIVVDLPKEMPPSAAYVLRIGL